MGRSDPEPYVSKGHEKCCRRRRQVPRGRGFEAWHYSLSRGRSAAEDRCWVIEANYRRKRLPVVTQGRHFAFQSKYYTATDCKDASERRDARTRGFLGSFGSRYRTQRAPGEFSTGARWRPSLCQRARRPRDRGGRFAQAGHRIHVVFRHPATLAAFDSYTGKNLYSIATCGDLDDVFYDAKRLRIYVSCGEGFIEVVADQGNSYVRQAKLATIDGARTSLFVPQIDRSFLAVRANRQVPAAVWMFKPGQCVSSAGIGPQLATGSPASLWNCSD
jgi:hypothetical protein